MAASSFSVSLVALGVTLATLVGTAHADPRRPVRLRAPRIASSELRAAQADLASPLAELRRAVPARAPVDGQLSPVSRTYRVELWRVRAPDADVAERLATVMRASLRPDPRDFVWYDDVTPVATPALDQIVAAFGLDGRERPPAERRAIEALAERALALVAAHPTLTLLVAQCGWADAVGGAYHGVMIFDRATSEVVWIHLDESWNAGG